MKILHTADWHIGKKLHKIELAQDFELFITWLCELLEREKVDLLLVSGDIFDLANPSSEARRQYYRALVRLKSLNCKIILTGGNHDSPAMLEAPKEILKSLNIDIIGGLPENLVDVIIPVGGTPEKPEIVVAAIPFLRDADLRKMDQGLHYDDRLEALKKAIENIFFEVGELCTTLYPATPIIATGHLFTAGIETSESERDIQIGNLAAFEASRFGHKFNYIALGHIHKPQRVRAAVPAFYSGSPYPLSFSERKDEKRVLLIDTQHSWEPQSIPIPGFRTLSKISGNLSHLNEALNALNTENTLENLIELELTEPQFDTAKLYALDELAGNFNKKGYKIVKHRASFAAQSPSATQSFGPQQQLQDLQPKEVFLELLGSQEYPAEDRNELIAAFDELLQEIMQDETLKL